MFTVHPVRTVLLYPSSAVSCFRVCNYLANDGKYNNNDDDHDNTRAARAAKEEEERKRREAEEAAHRQREEEARLQRQREEEPVANGWLRAAHTRIHHLPNFFCANHPFPVRPAHIVS